MPKVLRKGVFGNIKLKSNKLMLLFQWKIILLFKIAINIHILTYVIHMYIKKIYIYINTYI